MSLLRPIHHTFGPHVTFRYVSRAGILAWTPWRWKHGKALKRLQKELDTRLDGRTFLFGSGREALLAILKAINLSTGEEVIIQGLTCVVLPNAIHAAGGVPIYADLDQHTLNLTPDTVEKVITPRTRAVICQHTFGIPSDTDGLRALCDKHDLLLIEDCAHIIPDAAGPEEVCGKGDFVMFSFGRDKAVSGIAGGAAISRHKDATKNLEKLYDLASDHSLIDIARMLDYTYSYFMARPFYGLFIGKVMLYLLRKCHWLTPVVTDEEKKGAARSLLTRMPNACAILVISQFKKLHKINHKRRRLTRLYLHACNKKGWRHPHEISEELPLQKFPIFVRNPDRVRATLKHKNIHLDDGWTGAVICPRSCDAAHANYTPGSCKGAESIAMSLLALPTHPTMTKGQAQALLNAIEYHTTDDDHASL